MALLGLLVAWDVGRRLFATKEVQYESLASDLSRVTAEVSEISSAVEKAKAVAEEVAPVAKEALSVARKANERSQKVEFNGLTGGKRRRSV